MLVTKNTVQAIPASITNSRNFVKSTEKKANVFRSEIMQYFDKNGYLSWSSKKKKYIILGTNSPKNGLVDCPQCHVGQLMVIRSRTTKKRFMGCSNYYNGCRASSPLLQKAKLRATKIRCELCLWPIVLFRYSRKQKWSRQCSNFVCQSRKL
ncbi:MAG: DNA topoisomerase [Nitrososphaerota archaeon]